MPRLFVLITQEECLYDEHWTKEADNLFIDLLMELNALGDWKYGRPDHSAFNYCRPGMKSELDVNFTLPDVELRFDFLHKCYRVFSWMLRKHGLRHCIQSNILTAPVAVWDDIFESNSFSVAYQHCGDPSWNELKYLFTSVYPASPTSDNVPDLHSTNQLVDPEIVEPAYLTSEQSNNEVVVHYPTGNNFDPCTRHRERDVSFECSVNIQPQFMNPRQGTHTPSRIPRPPRKTGLSSCKGPSSEPLI
ncbi:NAC (No Apical Meristem) domain transcriptionalregulator superfamily protein [Striga asiatica]|uniref:NAC (No Apical Meristem) domain transcriptionalregulator superfamily protein n=1 Tax=Striga asiatica TaxID=4170 RepID=A0A5A7QGW7_STRAF|nr:NAC (No Apical Meristem) domain transcriptionalregulator superfamily protein [Striga asiatica]